MKRKIHVVPHTHWDREWYFTTSRSKVYLMKDLKDVLDTLEKDNNFKYYVLDAQASLLDDYIKWMPQDIDRIKKLVEDKRLIIGPWYTQSDQMVISGESIIRNLYYGIKKCKEFGGYMNVAYVPDSFGQAANMPQIYHGFGINDTLFWRGVSNDMVKNINYNWIGDDGSKVFVTQIPYGYYIGGPIPEKGEAKECFWNEICFGKAARGAATKNIYLPNGFDQAPIRKNLSEIIRQRNLEDKENEYVISNIENYISDVKAENPKLEEVSGELLIAKHMRIHKSIFSSRSDLKIMNTEIQNYVVNILEPLLSISHSLGNAYPHKAIEEVWKLLFENAAHDSIGSCISDSANEDVYMRYKQARDISINLVELHARMIATSIKTTSAITLTLFNTLPYKRDEVIVDEIYISESDFSLNTSEGQIVPYTIIEQKDLTEYVLSQTIRLNPSKDIYIPNKVYKAKIAIQVKDIPAFGYLQLQMDFGKSSNKELRSMDYLENEFYKVVINNNGSLNVYDKKQDKLYKNQAIFVENGDDGDSFNYSPPRDDMIITSQKSNAKVVIKSTDFYQAANINLEMMVPKDLEERLNQKTSIKLPIEMNIELKQSDPILYFDVKVDNHALSHRLCVQFNSTLSTSFNYADQQFGIIRRPNYYEKEMELYEASLQKEKNQNRSKELANWFNDEESWQEPPISIEPTQSFVSLSQEDGGIAVLPQGVREYEIIEEGSIISLTLFRSYGYMGKENLLYRPGRASGERIIETPDAQLLKSLSFNFGFIMFAGGFNDAQLSNLARKFNTPIEVYEYADFLNGRLIFSQEDSIQHLENNYSLFSTRNKLSVSAIKKHDEKDGYVIRLYNGKYHEAVDDKLIFNSNIEEAYYVDLLENKVGDIKHNLNTVTVTSIDHCKFVSIYIRLSKK